MTRYFVSYSWASRNRTIHGFGNTECVFAKALRELADVRRLEAQLARDLIADGVAADPVVVVLWFTVLPDGDVPAKE